MSLPGWPDQPATKDPAGEEAVTPAGSAGEPSQRLSNSEAGHRANSTEYPPPAAAEPRRVRPLVPRETAATDARVTRHGSSPGHTLRGRPALPTDARQWARAVDRRLKLWRGERLQFPAVPGTYLAQVSRASFCLDGIDVRESDARAAIDTGSAIRVLGSRTAQRLRAHAAILRRIQRLGRSQQALQPGEVFRWHAALACGLPSARPDTALTLRLTDVCFRMATPHRRLIPAVEEAARLYSDLLSDPLFPNFNGILARLMLTYALARMGLPPVVFDTDRNVAEQPATPRRLQELIAVSLDDLIASTDD